MTDSLKVGLIGRRIRDGENLPAIGSVLNSAALGILEGRHKLYVGKHTADTYARHLESLNVSGVVRSDAIRELDVVVVVGGDGTMLEAIRKYSPVPLLGINQGRLGFITDVPGSQAQSVVFEVLRGVVKADWGRRILLEHRIMLQSTIEENHRIEGQSFVPIGLSVNDVVLNRTTGRILEFEVSINGEFAYKVRADGLIIATPTGSTAYATAAGGSILNPTAKVIEVVAMYPQTLAYRPLVISDDDTVKIKLVSGDARIYLDGTDGPVLQGYNNALHVTKAKVAARIIHPNLDDLKYSYYSTLRNKLNWHLEPGTR